MKAYIVVGAGYGDEGKGLTTDWLVSEARKRGEVPIVARCNGGTQAAHTVVTPEGQRHVFKHHGSGSFLGAETYLGERFILNPIGFRQEREELPESAHRRILCHPDALVSLPVDMLINQALEELRGEKRHGSCGWGIGETLERKVRQPSRVVTLRSLQGLTLPEVRAYTAEYLSARLSDEVHGQLSSEWQERLENEDIQKRWLEDVQFMLKHVYPVLPEDLYRFADTLICEGAQGLGLDEDGEHFPHVTRSKTGSVYPLELIRESKAVLQEVIYVTRCYATRHGAGPLEREGDAHGCNVDDPTNIPNPWQGTLRSAPLDMGVLLWRCASDAAPLLREHPQTSVSIMVTCLDQASDDFVYYDNIGGRCTGPVENYLENHTHSADFMAGRLLSGLHMQIFMQENGTLEPQRGRLLCSTGPTRDTVVSDIEADEPISHKLREVLRRLKAPSVGVGA